MKNFIILLVLALCLTSCYSSRKAKYYELYPGRAALKGYNMCPVYPKPVKN
jgi:hypothetical protein